MGHGQSIYTPEISKCYKFNKCQKSANATNLGLQEPGGKHRPARKWWQAIVPYYRAQGYLERSFGNTKNKFSCSLFLKIASSCTNAPETLLGKNFLSPTINLRSQPSFPISFHICTGSEMLQGCFFLCYLTKWSLCFLCGFYHVPNMELCI